MLEAARLILRYVEGVSFDEFWENSEKRDAVSLRLSVIGESAHRIPPEIEALLPDVPFREIRGLRNRIAHDYGAIDFRIVWSVTQHDLRPLVSALERYFARDTQSPQSSCSPR
ncbi:HepT-like ribonuclease domain-containing protein [Geminisphaera colitermitum]|uniref:HepT-like ribonuclease domain-containing protein n=1 Tax=Geminisphaera colitermitum TaxID=1148786 RepID=UPI00069481C6|nr:HepT-like ribonuclease domain-containing protein [Geminisphaera colitermitum]